MTVLLLAALLLPPPTAGVPNPVELQDPAGDTGFSPTDAPAPDLRSVAVGMSPSGDLILRARFTPGTFDAAATYVQFSLQLERTDSTPDASTQCGNYLVDFNGVGKRSRNAKVQRLGSAAQSEVLEPFLWSSQRTGFVSPCQSSCYLRTSAALTSES